MGPGYSVMKYNPVLLFYYYIFLGLSGCVTITTFLGKPSKENISHRFFLLSRLPTLLKSSPEDKWFFFWFR